MFSSHSKCRWEKMDRFKQIGDLLGKSDEGRKGQGSQICRQGRGFHNAREIWAQ